MGVVTQVIILNQTPNAGKRFTGSQNGGSKLIALKGNNPDFHLRSLNFC